MDLDTPESELSPEVRGLLKRAREREQEQERAVERAEPAQAALRHLFSELEAREDHEGLLSWNRREVDYLLGIARSRGQLIYNRFREQGFPSPSRDGRSVPDRKDWTRNELLELQREVTEVRADLHQARGWRARDVTREVFESLQNRYPELGLKSEGQLGRGFDCAQAAREIVGKRQEPAISEWQVRELLRRLR